MSDHEVAKLHGVTFDIHSLSRVHTSIQWQQSRVMWLCERDENSKYFHSCLKIRRRQNALSLVMVDGQRVEGVQLVRNAVFSHFTSHFRVVNSDRPMVEGFEFSPLSAVEGGNLIKPFSVEKLHAAVWDCASYKCPEPNGINFGFLKELWSELKGDSFITEFHRNGKLTKGINTTFIGLIPKVDNPQNEILFIGRINVVQNV